MLSTHHVVKFKSDSCRSRL